MSSQKVNFTRNMICIIPLISLFAGIGLFSMLEKFSSKFKKHLNPNLLLIFLVFLSLLKPAKIAYLKVKYMANFNDSRLVATKWMERNITDKSKVLIIKELKWFRPHLENFKFYFEENDLLKYPMGY